MVKKRVCSGKVMTGADQKRAKARVRVSPRESALRVFEELIVDLLLLYIYIYTFTSFH